MNVASALLVITGLALGYYGIRRSARRTRRFSVRHCDHPGCYGNWRLRVSNSCTGEPSDPRSHTYAHWLRTVWLTDLSPEEAMAVDDDRKEWLMLAFTRELLDDLVRKRKLNGHDAEHLLNDIRSALKADRQHSKTPLS